MAEAAACLLRPFPKGNYAHEMERRADLFLDSKWGELYNEYTEQRDGWDWHACTVNVQCRL